MQSPDPARDDRMQYRRCRRSGRALYVGISSYNSARNCEAAAILRDLGTPCLIHQPSYNMLNRWIERDGLLDRLEDAGMGSIVFTPLAQGMLTGKYLKGIPSDSRAAQGKSLAQGWLTDDMIQRLNGLNDLAAARGQSLAQMAVAWTLRDKRVTSALIGASPPSQVVDCVGALDRLEFTADELARIDARWAGDMNIWRNSTEEAGER